jgi:hypothetical protein
LVVIWENKKAREKNQRQKIMRVKLSFVFLGTLLCFGQLTHKTLAATSTPNTPSGITLSPAIVQSQIQATEAQHQLDFKITNNKSVPQTINITTADFNTLDESGGLVFVGTNPTKLQKKYGLATWLTLPQTSVTLQPKQTSTINAFITNQDSLAPGGHYGALMLSLEEANQASLSSNNKVSLHPIATSLLFVSKLGGDTHKLQLSNVYTSHNIFQLPGTATLRFHNNGNTHLVPRGEVNVTTSRGKLISKGIINENSQIILPGTYRRYAVDLHKISTPLLPGKYKMDVNFRFDGYDQFRTYQTSQFLLTPAFLLLILVVIFALVVVLFILKNRKFRANFSRLRKASKKLR